MSPSPHSADAPALVCFSGSPPTGKGKFAYPVPSDANFEAAALVKQFFYEYCGPWTDFLGPFNQTLYTSRVAACRLWRLLQDLQGYLWVNASTGKTHPPGYFAQSDTDSTATAMFSLFGTGQTWMSFGYDSYVAANKARRRMPAPTR